MKSKTIPADIQKKTIEEAQKEIKELVLELESKEIDLEKSIDKYTRIINLDNYILQKFKKKLSNIKNIKRNEDGKISFKEKE